MKGRWRPRRREIFHGQVIRDCKTSKSIGPRFIESYLTQLGKRLHEVGFTEIEIAELIVEARKAALLPDNEF